MFIIYTLYAIPAMISLPRGVRPGLEEQTIEEAVQVLKKQDLDGREMIEEARLLVGQRMAYCRRNSYESYQKAFSRGYGFCQQQAFALAAILDDLNFEAAGDNGSDIHVEGWNLLNGVHRVNYLWGLSDHSALYGKIS